MEEKSVPWWRKALHFALDGIRSGFGLFARPAKSNGHHDLHQSPVPQEKVAPSENIKEGTTLIAPPPAHQPVAETGNELKTRHEIEAASVQAPETPPAQASSELPPAPEPAISAPVDQVPELEATPAPEPEPHAEPEPGPEPTPAPVEVIVSASRAEQTQLAPPAEAPTETGNVEPGIGAQHEPEPEAATEPEPELQREAEISLPAEEKAAAPEIPIEFDAPATPVSVPVEELAEPEQNSKEIDTPQASAGPAPESFHQPNRAPASETEIDPEPQPIEPAPSAEATHPAPADIPVPAPAAAPVESNESVAIETPPDAAGQPAPLEEESLDEEIPAVEALAQHAGKTEMEQEPEPEPTPEPQEQEPLQQENQTQEVPEEKIKVNEVQEHETQKHETQKQETEEPAANPTTKHAAPDEAPSPMEMNEHIPDPASEEAESDSANAIEATPEETAPTKAAALESSQESASAPSGETHPEDAPAATPANPPVQKPLIKLESRDNQADLSPFSVIVDQVYDGPLDLLLDLIRKQDIDIYDIPIARITAQFLAYVNQLKATDVDVAGEFIYTASLLIHIKSKMLLPRAPSGPDDAAEDPRRELVERLLEHERFKNAAQMLQQKQMLEAATWSNPGIHEFRDDVSAEPEIAADTVDLVRIFRDILERARNRPVINVAEDSVTVGQMIQFLARRLTMEDKPVALRRLLSHTRSERALIAMFLALLELVRMQAILLRQDRAFSEIFIKKQSGFENLMNEGLASARDDWQ